MGKDKLHMGMLGALGFLIYPGWKKRWARVGLGIDILLAGLVFVCALYLLFFEDALHARNEVPLLIDLIFAGIAIVLVLELNRRTSGPVIPILGIFFLSYILWWGGQISGMFYFRGMTLTRVLYRMYFTDEGMFGLTASISSTFVFMFILFASFLLKSGGGDFIIKLARTMTHRITGGPGLVAVLGSGLMGAISGSAVANKLFLSKSHFSK